MRGHRRTEAERGGEGARRSAGAWLGYVAAAVGIVSGLVGLMFVLLPNLQPEPPARHKGVKLTRLDFQPRLTFRQYLQRVDQPATSFTPERLSQPGAFLEYRFVITGYKGQRLPVRYELIDASSGDQVAEARPFTIEPLAAQDSGTWHAWVPLPRRARRLFVILQVFQPEGVVPLDRLRTASFRTVG
jgi:hypothetical protein